MIGFLYDLIYVLPISILGILQGNIFVKFPEKMLLPCVIGIVITAIITGLRHVEKRYRVLMIGVPVVVAIVFFAVTVFETEKDLLRDYSWLGVVLGVVIDSYVAGGILCCSFFIGALPCGSNSSFSG